MPPRQEERSMKQCTSKFLLSILLVLTVILGNFSVCTAADTTAEKIITKKDSYDGKEVSVKGTVSNLKLKTANVKDDFTTFTLVGEAGGRINVFIWGSLKLKPGQKVQVTGVYRKVRRTARHNYYNEIEASEVK
jgi:hypothetical protein